MAGSCVGGLEGMPYMQTETPFRHANGPVGVSHNRYLSSTNMVFLHVCRPLISSSNSEKNWMHCCKKQSVHPDPFYQTVSQARCCCPVVGSLPTSRRTWHCRRMFVQWRETGWSDSAKKHSNKLPVGIQKFISRDSRSRLLRSNCSLPLDGESGVV